MATLVLQAAGAYLGGFFGPVGSAIGAAVGSMAGYTLDRSLIESTKRYEGARLSGLPPFAAEEGAAVPRVYGTMRMSGTLIWATHFEEVRQTKRQGAKGGARVTSYSYFGNAAFALCEGPIASVRRVWADGRELDLNGFDLRVHTGSAGQAADPLIEARQGDAPAYRGTAYVVFEHLPLEPFGNRLPQFQFEVIKTAGELASSIQAVCLIPGSTEWGLAPFPVTRTPEEGVTEHVNRHVLHAPTDLVASLDELQALCPNLKHVAIVSAWFGDDLRAGQCRIRPMLAENAKGPSSHAWRVNGIDQAGAQLVSLSDGKAAFGGTPSDESLIAALREIAARGLKATLYPFIMMDVPNDNLLPSPDGATGQPAYPWRGRITCTPAPGLAGTADKTEMARLQVATFCGTAAPGEFAATETGAEYTGNPEDFGYRRMVLHHAHLAAIAGGVDAFLLGSELRSLTALRDETGAFPFVGELMTLAAEVRTILGTATKITYAADWSEYFGHQPADGSGDVIFHLDPLWAHPAIDAVGIDNYMPLSDWRDSDLAGENPDGMSGPDDAQGMGAAIVSGEGFDWYYASPADRENRLRTLITDGAYGKPWIYRYKDLQNWWAQPHFDRLSGIELTAPTPWVPRSKPFWFTELGCPSVDKGSTRPSVFPDLKSSENGAPPQSSGGRNDLAQMRFLKAHFSHWNPESAGFTESANPAAPNGLHRMVDPERIYLWAWDARPFPAFPHQASVWGDCAHWQTGHWLNGRLSSVELGDLINAILADHGLPPANVRDADGAMQGYVLDSPGSARQALEPLAALFGLAASDLAGNLSFGREGSQGRLVLQKAVFSLEAGVPILQLMRTPDQDLPAEVTMAFRDPGFLYQAGSVRAADRAGRGRKSESLAAPAALDGPIAQVLAGDLIRRIWNGRTEIRFSAPAAERRIRPGLSVAIDGLEGDWLVSEVEEGLVRRITARSYRSIPSEAAKVHQIAVVPPQLQSAPSLEFMDLPFSGASGLGGFQVAAASAPWRPVIIMASPETDGFSQRAMLEMQAAMGRLEAPLPAGQPGIVDWSSALMVRFADAEPASVSRLQMLNGANLAALATVAGGHEVLQFQNAEEVSAGLWKLTGLLRGQGGTGDQMASGAVKGARLVLLDGAPRPAGLRDGEAGLALNWKCGPANLEPGPLFASVLASGGIRAITPLAPVHLRVAPTADGQVHLRWIRCGRIGADSWDNADIPLGEEREAYRIRLLDAGSQTLFEGETASPEWSMDSVLLAALGPGPLTAEVRQLGAVAGLPARIQLAFL